MRFTRTLSTVAAACAAAFCLTAPAAAAPGEDRATGWYLALGDSLAAGYLHDSGDHRADGYVGEVLDTVREDRPRTRLVNLACSGETTVSMIDGGRCSYEEGSQLAQAVEFLHAHRRHTQLVTIDIGGNDVAPCGWAGLPPACTDAARATLRTNLPRILGALREAAGPDVQIVVLNYYDPFLAFWLLGSEQSRALATQSVELLAGPGGVNEIIGDAADDVAAPVADVESAFQTTMFTPTVTLPGVGSVPLNVARICQWTTMCTDVDFHPNPAGYAVIGDAVSAVVD